MATTYLAYNVMDCRLGRCKTVASELIQRTQYAFYTLCVY